ncbi:MAG: DUF3667 domain-containing protein [Bdellovibrionales bacterium]|nr:DUF3667 domain-containing protein [Bdellovibrionales bacterium]NQZ18974.1 DUF3667 domain-containing protein [Bdellovibrionales bacterium]
MICLNCGTEFEGNYCPQCNQKSITKRLTIVSVIKDFMDALSDSDKGFLKTVIDLSKDPGSTIRDYIDGKRSRYLSAGKYTFFLTVLFTINLTYLEHHFGMFETMMTSLDSAKVYVDEEGNIDVRNDLDKKSDGPDYKVNIGASGINVTDEKKDKKFADIKGNEPFEIDFTINGKQYYKQVTKAEFLVFLQKLIPHYHRTLFDFLKFLIVIWIPIFSFFSYVVFFKAPYNMAEHITFNSYTFAHILLISMVLSPCYWFLPELNDVTFSSTLLCGGFYLIFSYMQFFSMRSYRFIKASFALFMSLTTYFTVILCLMVGLGFYIAIDNFHLL